jgi:hypothetical protein
MARTYQIVLILRKVVLISWMILFKFTPVNIFLIISAGYQLLHFCYIIVIRPFSTVKDNLIEVFNEIIFTFMLFGFIYLNREERWEHIFTDAYVYLIMAPGMFMILVTLSKFNV